MPSALTDRQAEILAYIQKREHDGGLIPTLDEIRTHFGFSSANAVREHLRLIEKKGYLQLSAGRPRAIRLARNDNHDWADVVRVPVLGRIPAGEPCSAIEEVESVLALPREHFRAGKLFALRVKGESMVGAGILDGDFAVLDASRETADGQIAAVVFDEEATLKRVFRTRAGIRLVAENPDFAPRDVPNRHLESLRIAGVYVGLLRAC